MNNADGIGTLFSPFSPPRLLPGESVEEFEGLRAELEQSIKPKGIIEKIYVNDILELTWEILRLRRIKINIIRNARLITLEMILLRIDPNLGARFGGVYSEAHRLAAGWLENNSDKEFAQELLQKRQLDESAIDAEAFRRVFSDVQQLDKMLMSLEARFSKTIRCIAEYRESFALQVERSTTQLLASNDAPLLAPANESAA